jgi:hypothetical protein
MHTWGHVAKIMPMLIIVTERTDFAGKKFCNELQSLQLHRRPGVVVWSSHHDLWQNLLARRTMDKQEIQYLISDSNEMYVVGTTIRQILLKLLLNFTTCNRKRAC